jgi:DNA repair and recombination protein RAD54B
LSGTPIQNDLSEFYTMVDFINPGLLKTYNTFRKNYEAPILLSRQPNATPDAIEKGERASEELSEITSHFILRRTADLLSEYLPPKTEYVLFCRPTTAQIEIYRNLFAEPLTNTVLNSPEASLALITLLKKVCNSPSLLKPKAHSTSETKHHLSSTIPSQLLAGPASTTSSKLRVLDRLLHHLRTTTQEKVVLVSNYTSTLDLLQSHLTRHSYPFLRLDGTTVASKRQDLVDTFNRTPPSICFAFLLSAKAGGVGLNLIGASRLVLFDVDWNPSTDLQAMARIHRDGQKKPVRIYRLLVAGAMDEKVWQRQVTKLGLADSVVDQKKNVSSFSQEELRDLFRLDTGGGCRTHELLRCGCPKDGSLATNEVPVPAEEGPREEEADDELTETVVHDSDAAEDSDAELLDILGPRIQKASQLRGKAPPRGSDAEAGGEETKQATSMQSLMRYAHIDTSHFGDEISTETGGHHQQRPNGGITDEVLLSVLREEKNRVSFVFAKTSEKKLDEVVEGEGLDRNQS